METEKTKIQTICEAYGLSQTDLSLYFKIPIRSIQDWHAGRRTPPDYVVELIEKILRIEGPPSPEVLARLREERREALEAVKAQMESLEAFKKRYPREKHRGEPNQ
jgi:transcriptional regulator with XRE-family HTH domain